MLHGATASPPRRTDTSAAATPRARARRSWWPGPQQNVAPFASIAQAERSLVLEHGADAVAGAAAAGPDLLQLLRVRHLERDAVVVGQFLARLDVARLR